MLLYDLLLSQVGHEARVQPCGRSSHLAWRAAALAAVAAAYVGIRQAVTGGHQLVSVFRKVGVVHCVSPNFDKFDQKQGKTLLSAPFRSILPTRNRWRIP